MVEGPKGTNPKGANPKGANPKGTKENSPIKSHLVRISTAQPQQQQQQRASSELW